jgi:hypothetical protein
LDEARRESTSLVVGEERINDKRSYSRPQVEAEDNVHHGPCQRGVGYEETTRRTHHCANVEKEVSG